MPAKLIHLVRHGEVHNPQRILYGRLPEFPLSDRGRQMAKVSADALAAEHPSIERVLSSPLLRTRQSAEPIADDLGLEVALDERLIEPANWFEGRRMTGEYGAVYRPRSWGKLVNPLKPSWGEPYKSIERRMREVVLDVARTLPEGGEAALVTHQLPIWVLHLSATGAKTFAHNPRKRRCALSSITSFAVDAGGSIAEVAYDDPAAELNASSLDVGAV